MLTLTGVAVGLIVLYMPGHAGPDPATESLIGMPLPLSALPGLGLALIVGLAGGVSLGPENPITAINIALVAAAGARLLPKVPRMDWIILAAAGTIGAMFGTPVAAALIFSQTWRAITKRRCGIACSPRWWPPPPARSPPRCSSCPISPCSSTPTT